MNSGCRLKLFRAPCLKCNALFVVKLLDWPSLFNACTLHTWVMAFNYIAFQ